MNNTIKIGSCQVHLFHIPTREQRVIRVFCWILALYAGVAVTVLLMNLVAHPNPVSIAAVLITIVGAVVIAYGAANISRQTVEDSLTWIVEGPWEFL